MRIYCFLQTYTSTDARKSWKNAIKTCFWVLSAWVYNVWKERTFMIISKTHLSESMEIAKKRVMNNFLVRNCMCRRCRRKEAFCEFIGNALKETALSSTTFNVRVDFKLYTPFKTEVFSRFRSVLRSDNIQR